MPPIPPHNTAVVEQPWDGSVVARIPNDAGEAVLRKEYAWVDPNADPNTKAAYKFPHHEVGADGAVGAANLSGCRNGMSRIPQADMPEGDQAGVREHLQHHMDAMMASQRPPRDMLCRAQPGDFEVRQSDEGGDVLVGHFSVFNQWTEINSAYEGRFMEQVRPGAFARTLKNNREQMRVTFNHGQDPTMGDQVLGIPTVIEEDGRGARYEVPLFDGIPPLLLDGLRHGAYGSSFRFRVVKDEWVEQPKASATNPDALPERSILEAQVYEFGPVTFPAYSGATAGIRSTTDAYLLSVIRNAARTLPDAGPEDLPHSDEGTRDEPPVVPPEPPKAPAVPARRMSQADFVRHLQESL